MSDDLIEANMLTDNVVSIDGGRNTFVSPAHRELVGHCRKLLDQTMAPLLEGFMEKLDDKLYDLSDKSSDDTAQTAYFSTLRDVRKHSKAMLQVFTQSVLSDFDIFWESGSASDVTEVSNLDLDSSELSLVDEADLEDELALDKMIARGEAAFHPALQALNQRFSVLISDSVDTQSNPVSPKVICLAFQKAIKLVQTETAVRLVIYKLFEKYALRYFGGLYDDLNVLLERAGISADVAPGSKRNPVAPAVSRQRNSFPDSDMATPVNDDSPQAESAVSVRPSGDDGAAMAEMFKTLQQLIASQATMGGAGSVPLVGATPGMAVPQAPMAPGASQAGGMAQAYVEPVQQSALINALNSLQAAPAVGVADLAGPIRLKQALGEQLGVAAVDLNSQSLGMSDSSTLDVVSMMFEFVVEDKNLPDAMKALLGRLQIPMLKVAIQDHAFFSTRNHPARKLLNDLANVALSWTDDGDRSPGSLYGKVEAAVNHITSYYETDIIVFEQAAREFESFHARESRGAKLTEKRTRQVNQGKEQLALAKREVANALRNAIAGKSNIPQVVKSLLKEGWRDVLLLIYLRQGPDSSDWRDAIKLVDRLLWSVEPKPNPGERQKLLAEIPELLRLLRDGLNNISYDQHKITSIFRALQITHVACLKNKIPVATCVVDEDTILDTDELVTETVEILTTPLDDVFLESADKLDLRTWVEITDEEGQVLRVKLSWKSKFSDTWMFVNRKGLKAMELTRTGVAMLFRDQRIRVIEDSDKPIMDRAMNAMITALKNRQDPTE